MKNLFDMLQAIFGKNIISRTIGTRTNVIKLPTNKSSPLKNEFDVFKSAENPAVFEKLKKVIEDEAPYISRMNDAERLIYEGNVKRLHDYLVSIGEIKPTISAEVIGLGTKEPISGKGLESLVEEAGQTSPPGTLVGDIQSRINKLKSLAKEKGMSAEEILQDFASGQKGMSRLNDEGLVRSTAREILINDIKAGKIKNITVSEAINMGEPLDPFRRIYGEGALEQLDSLIPNFRNLKTEMEAEKFARSKFKFEPDENRLPGSVSIEEGRKAEQEYGIKLTPKEMEKILKEGEEETKGLDYLTGQEPPEKKANGGRIGFGIGGGKKILDLITGANKKLKGKKSMETVNPKKGKVTSTKETATVAQKYDQDIIKAADEIYPSYDDPKIAADQIVDSYAQMKYGLEDQYNLSNKERMDLYRQAYDYVMDYNRGAIRKTPAKFNISDEETAEAFTNFARENDPEGFKKIQKIVDDINNKNALEEFNIKDREPNAKGGSVGLGYLMGE